MSLRAKNKQKARQAIIQAAITLIGQQGVEATTTRQIAAKAGVSYQTLYNYFPTKALILKEVLQEEVELWNRQVDFLIKSYDGDLFATLDQVHQHSVALFLGEKRELWHALTLSVLAQLNAEDDKLREESLAALVNIPHERYYSLLALAQGMGHLHPDVDLHLLAHTLFCIADHSFLMLLVLNTEAPTLLETLSAQMQLILTPHLLERGTP